MWNPDELTAMTRNAFIPAIFVTYGLPVLAGSAVKFLLSPAKGVFMPALN
jgi:hypothetical protein